MAESRRKFDRDFREGAVRLVRETGKPVAQVARDLGINSGTLGNWVNAKLLGPVTKIGVMLGLGVLPARIVAGQPATLAVLGLDGKLAADVKVDLGNDQRVTTDATGRASFTAPGIGAVLLAKVSGTSAAALLDSAAQLFARGGYEGASVDLIAESAGYSKGAFYSNFESKEAIFLELLDAHKRREIDALAQLLAQDVPASELVSLIRNSESSRVSDLDFGLLSAEFQLQACRDKAFAKTYAKRHRTHVDTMAGLITKLFAKA